MNRFIYLTILLFTQLRVDMSFKSFNSVAERFKVTLNVKKKNGTKTL